VNKITKKEFKYILTTRPSLLLGETSIQVSDTSLKDSIELAKVQGYDKKLRYAENYSNGLKA
jgi:hypothetical protein